MINIDFTRREFIKQTFKTAIAASITMRISDTFGEGQFKEDTHDKIKSRVIEVVCDKVWQGDLLDKDIVNDMVDRGVCSLTHKKDVNDAWKSMFSPADVVGIKLNALGGPRLSPSHEVVNRLIEGLKVAGVKENNIIVWDRLNGHLERCGFKLSDKKEGVRVYQVDGGPGGGYDHEVFYEAAIPGDNGSKRSEFANIVTKHVTKLINVPALKDHPETGVTLALKNLSFGSINNTGRFHNSNCDPAIAEVCAHPQLRNKTVFHVLHGLRGIYNGGPQPGHEEWQWNYNALLFSFDPVAMDYLGLQIIEAKRKFERMPPLRETMSKVYPGKDYYQNPKHIHTSAKLGLGTDDPDKIDHVKINL